MAAIAANSLAPQNVLQDPMMSALNLTVIACIADMVSRQVRQQEKKMDAIPTVTKSYPVWVELVSLPPNFRMAQFIMFNGSGNPAQHLAYYIFRCGLVIKGPWLYEMHHYCNFSYNHWREQLLLGMRISQKPLSSAGRPWNKNFSVSSATRKDELGFEADRDQAKRKRESHRQYCLMERSHF